MIVSVTSPPKSTVEFPLLLAYRFSVRCAFTSATVAYPDIVHPLLPLPLRTCRREDDPVVIGVPLPLLRDSMDIADPGRGLGLGLGGASESSVSVSDAAPKPFPSGSPIASRK